MIRKYGTAADQKVTEVEPPQEEKAARITAEAAKGSWRQDDERGLQEETQER